MKFYKWNIFHISIIYNRCCDPYLKDVTSHAIKSVVMKKIYHRPSYFCNTFNLETNFQVNMSRWYYVSTQCLSGLFCKSWRRCHKWFDSRHHFQQCQHFKVIENCIKNEFSNVDIIFEIFFKVQTWAFKCNCHKKIGTILEEEELGLEDGGN